MFSIHMGVWVVKTKKKSTPKDTCIVSLGVLIARFHLNFTLQITTASRGCIPYSLLHICKTFHRFRKILDGLVRIPMLDSVPHTMLNMTLQYHLPHLIER